MHVTSATQRSPDTINNRKHRKKKSLFYWNVCRWSKTFRVLDDIDPEIPFYGAGTIRSAAKSKTKQRGFRPRPPPRIPYARHFERVVGSTINKTRKFILQERNVTSCPCAVDMEARKTGKKLHAVNVNRFNTLALTSQYMTAWFCDIWSIKKCLLHTQLVLLWH
jgi:hypothetical protein